ncbi:pollen receptor-like kinase 4 [Dioscorea cayenensis subsp. rotundata]|uniref:Pollen receptor-like kinase 4 n=1 Tax=Dioscorea cayennensis subsp. rotundata TaxID=55577 RepID=A0AB40D0S8_DIOCR|nr:pollen receptor-like kinase 4 [Dioscorea cayenensis subsp. rotundata]
MRLCLYFNCFIIFLFVFCREVLSDSDDRYLKDEYYALIALKQAFSNPPFAANWSGEQCSVNSSSWLGLQCINNRVVSISLSGLGLSGLIGDPLILANLTELTLLSLKNNSIYGAMMNFSYNQKLTIIDLSLNSFTGPISTSLTTLNVLQSLHLNRNQFNGSIPPLNQSTLKSFDVSFNSLSGEIPSTVTLRSFGPRAYFGNPGLCGVPTFKTCVISEEKHNKIKEFLLKPSLISILIILDIILLLVQAYSLYVFYKKSHNKDQRQKINDNPKTTTTAATTSTTTNTSSFYTDMMMHVDRQMKVTLMNGSEGESLDLKELLQSPAEGLGKGNFGSCYKTTMDSGSLLPMATSSTVFMVNALHTYNNLHSSTKYIKLHYLTLTSYYQYDILGGRGGNRRAFQWNTRLEVAKGVAKAMAYLHKMTTTNDNNNLNDTNFIIPHGNLKASNVLLDDNDTPLLTDYALTPLFPPPLAANFMLAYKSPEHLRWRKVSNKSDVWSYGCLLVELITGKFPKYSSPEGGNGVDLGNWIHKAVREEWTNEVFDMEISGKRKADKGMYMLLQIALRCCEKSPEKRPEMEEVVEEVVAIKPCMAEEDEDEDEVEAESTSTSN